jgi:hypothetical protein
MVMFGIKWKWQTLKIVSNLDLGLFNVLGIWDVGTTFANSSLRRCSQWGGLDGWFIASSKRKWFPFCSSCLRNCS